MSSASSHSESRSIEMLTHRSRVLSCPSRDSRLTALVSMSRGVASADSGIADALVAMRSNFDIDSIVMTCQLVKVRRNYLIPLEYKLHQSLPGEHPYDAFPNGFSLSTDALEVGLSFLLHPVIETCLEGWHISPSQMVPNSWRYSLVITSPLVPDSKWEVRLPATKARSHSFSLSLIVGTGASDRVDFSDDE
ncbi:hypothetical protein BHM03_00040148 [Ensete ventricosum]|nr:hypothetical protein BHM03_00040148 [Ensete ventricosum]